MQHKPPHHADEDRASLGTEIKNSSERDSYAMAWRDVRIPVVAGAGMRLAPGCDGNRVAQFPSLRLPRNSSVRVAGNGGIVSVRQYQHLVFTPT